jgi:hypothetical protein
VGKHTERRSATVERESEKESEMIHGNSFCGLNKILTSIQLKGLCSYFVLRQRKYYTWAQTARQKVCGK